MYYILLWKSPIVFCQLFALLGTTTNLCCRMNAFKVVQIRCTGSEGKVLLPVKLRYTAEFGDKKQSQFIGVCSKSGCGKSGCGKSGFYCIEILYINN